MQSIKDALLSSQTTGALVSIGSSIALDSLGAPPIATNFISNFLGSVAAGLAGGASGGGGPPTQGEVEKQGQSIFAKIGEGLSKFGQGFVNAVGSVISFGQKVIEGVGNFTIQGFKKAISVFSSIFNRQTQESIYQDEAGLRQATVTQNGDTWTWQNGSSRIDYNTVTGEAIETFGVGGQARITGLGQDGSGNVYYQKLTYENVINGTATLTQSYDNGRLTGWTYGIEGTPILTLRCQDSISCMTADGNTNLAEVDISQPIEYNRFVTTIEGYITIPEFAKTAGISAQAVHKAIQKGRIKRYKRFGGKIFIVHRSELRRFKKD